MLMMGFLANSCKTAAKITTRIIRAIREAEDSVETKLASPFMK